MQKVMPTLTIANYQPIKAFYTDKLGFAVDWEYRFDPGFPVFMQVSRDGMVFYLTEHSGDCQGGSLTYLIVSDVDAWFRELQEKGVEEIEPLNEAH
jgi:catechol 2,3-dioxygenase-like lactoylglutathione lyase family enzyme